VGTVITDGEDLDLNQTVVDRPIRDPCLGRSSDKTDRVQLERQGSRKCLYPKKGQLKSAEMAEIA
jgi:hypothetical protein